MAQGQKPVWTYRIKGMRAAVWANQSPEGVWMNATITRRYKDKDGEQWKETGAYRCHELPIVRVLSDMAHDWMCKHESAEAAESNE
jgi:hypothetical protein